MTKFPLWKHFLVLFVLAIGLIYSAPNLYPPDHAIQISGESGGQDLNNAVLNKALTALDKANIAYKSSESNDKSLLIRLVEKDDQLRAKAVVEAALLYKFVVALNLAPTTPEWLVNIGAEPMKLGLDLSGGVHFLLEVDTQFAIEKRLDGYKAQIKKLLREERVRGIVDSKGLTLTGKFKTEDLRAQAKRLVADDIRDLIVTEKEANGYFWLTWGIGENLQKTIADEAVAQNLTALRNRVNELGVSEPLVQRQGLGRIVVELPGVQDSATAKRIIGKTANLEFRMESDGKGGSESYQFRDQYSRRASASLERTVIITGEQVSTASTSFD